MGHATERQEEDMISAMIIAGPALSALVIAAGSGAVNWAPNATELGIAMRGSPGPATQYAELGHQPGQTTCVAEVRRQA